MLIELTPENIGQVVGTAIAAAIGGTASITFGITKVWRLFKKDEFHKSTGNVVRNVACAAEEGIRVAEQLKELVEEMRENSQQEREIFQDILRCQQTINASNQAILQQLQTLILMRSRDG